MTGVQTCALPISFLLGKVIALYFLKALEKHPFNIQISKIAKKIFFKIAIFYLKIYNKPLVNKIFIFLMKIKKGVFMADQKVQSNPITKIDDNIFRFTQGGNEDRKSVV